MNALLPRLRSFTRRWRLLTRVTLYLLAGAGVKIRRPIKGINATLKETLE
ncbi:MAG: hypothetical protein GPOALKHO_001734 [Sodalis sp.]|nr:MAG: hypothetical protein GPOALKHO_001734 [Sodalis sp.]